MGVLFRDLSRAYNTLKLGEGEDLSHSLRSPSNHPPTSLPIVREGCTLYIYSHCFVISHLHSFQMSHESGLVLCTVENPTAKPPGACRATNARVGSRLSRACCVAAKLHTSQPPGRPGVVVPPAAWRLPGPPTTHRLPPLWQPQHWPEPWGDSQGQMPACVLTECSFCKRSMVDPVLASSLHFFQTRIWHRVGTQRCMML